MPYINVKLAGKLDKNQKQEIAKEITDVMQRVLTNQHHTPILYLKKLNLKIGQLEAIYWVSFE